MTHRDIFPASVTRQQLAATIEALEDFRKGFVLASTNESSTVANLYKGLALCHGYTRLARWAEILGQTCCSGSEEQDQDQICSIILYVLLGFNRIRNWGGARVNHDGSFLWFNLEGVWESMIDNWATANPGACDALLESIEAKHPDFCKVHALTLHDAAPKNPPLVDVGILTALEHEYQSVLRRLDRIYRSTGDGSHGFAILDRKRDQEDLKSTAERTNTSRSTGWTLGAIGDKSVLVVCTGEAGRESVSSAIDTAKRESSRTPIQWFLVGVCAGTTRDWPLGSVLISAKGIYKVSLVKTDYSYMVKGHSLPNPSLVCKVTEFSPQRMFRPTPSVESLKCNIAKFQGVPVYGVAFACVDQVVNVHMARARIKEQLAKYAACPVPPDEEIGIEMEGAGLVTAFPRLNIIKAVCDYADDGKKEWNDRDKNLVQLYAAEIAADCVVQITGGGICSEAPEATLTAPLVAP